MWLFITARLRRWLIFAILVPLGTTIVHLVRSAVEKRSGESGLTRALTRVENFGQRKPKRRYR